MNGSQYTLPLVRVLHWFKRTAKSYWRHRMRNFLIIALLASTTVSHAATIGFTGVGPGNIFNYNLTVSNERVMAGDFFVIYDFAGAISAAGPSADWASLIGSDSNLANDLTISDVRFTYSGTT